MKIRKQLMIVTGAFMAATFLVSAIRSDADSIRTLRPNLNVLKVGHRGARLFAPENTLISIEKSLEFGFDFIEMDIRFTKDGVPVLMHDERVDRTTDGKGRIADFTLDEIKKLDGGNAFEYHDKFKGTRVPTLEEALKIIQGRASVYLDQKEAPRPIVIELLKKYGFYPDHLLVVGSNEFQLEFLKLAPEAQVMPNISGAKDLPEILKTFPRPKAFNTTPMILSRELIDKAHTAGVMIFVNLLGLDDSPAMMKKMILNGVDAIQTDKPDQLLKVIEKMKKETADKDDGKKN